MDYYYNSAGDKLSLDSLLMPPPPRRLGGMPRNQGQDISSSEEDRTFSSYFVPGDKRTTSVSDSTSSNTIVGQHTMTTATNNNNNYEQQQQQQQHEEQQQQAHYHHLTVETPTVKFRDIVGHKDAKLRLEEALLPLAMPTLPPEVLAGIRGGSLGGILLHGPPGTGKTLLAQALAGEVGASFLSISPADILSKYVGESEKSIKQLFMVAKQEARLNRHGCCILFLDEIDALGQSRSNHASSNSTTTASSSSSNSNPSGTRVLAELLIQLTILSKEQQRQPHRNQPDQQQYEDEAAVAGDEYEQGEVMQQRRYCTFCGQQQPGTVRCTTIGGDEKEHYEEYNDTKPQCQQQNTATTSYSTMWNGEADVRTTTKSTLRILPPLPQQQSSRSNTSASTTSTATGGGRVILIAATNRPVDCDPALLRRFSVRVLIDLPTFRDRRRMIKSFLININHTLSKSDIQQISFATEGFSGSDLESLSREAIMAPIRDCLKEASTLKRKARQECHRILKSNQKKKMHHDHQQQHEHHQLQHRSSIQGEGVSLLLKDDGTTPPKREEILDSTNSAPMPLVLDPNELARDHLLLAFRKLRPVILQDFEDAYTFWMGGGVKKTEHRKRSSNDVLIGNFQAVQSELHSVVEGSNSVVRDSCIWNDDDNNSTGNSSSSSSDDDDNTITKCSAVD